MARRRSGVPSESKFAIAGVQRIAGSWPERRERFGGRRTTKLLGLAERVHAQCSSNVHRGVARPMIADDGIGPK
jgi:hypothetical protein